jgi:plastocyanin
MTGFSMRLPCALLLGGLILAAPATAGQSHKISQIDRKFSVADLTVNRGDTITFTNDEQTTVHNVSGKGAASFNTGTQKPGEAKQVVMDQPGTMEVRCAIHPLMKMTVTVK